MTQVMMEEVPLEEALMNANLVAVVTVADPPSRTEELPVSRPAEDGGVAPPYGLFLRRLRIEEILLDRPLGSPPPLEVGQVLEVRPADWEMDLSGHEAYYCDGIGESPIVFCYVGGCPDDATTFLAFLWRDSQQIRFAIDGGRESLERRPRVEAVLAARG